MLYIKPENICINIPEVIIWAEYLMAWSPDDQPKWTAEYMHHITEAITPYIIAVGSIDDFISILEGYSN